MSWRRGTQMALAIACLIGSTSAIQMRQKSHSNEVARQHTRANEMESNDFNIFSLEDD